MIERIVAGDKAGSLGQAEGRLQAALLALEIDQARHGSAAATAGREALVRTAADALWQFVVQREACGAIDDAWVREHYQVPPIVWRRLGARSGRAAA